MKITKILGIIIIMLAASSCATEGGHTYVGGKCISCWNNPLTKEPINHDGKADLQLAEPETKGNQTSTSEQKDKNVYPRKYVISFNAPVDVDVAYIKLKQEFEYQSEQEVRQEWGSMAGAKMQTFAYAYDATPNVYYRMRANRKHRGIFIIIDSQIEKKTTRSSKVTISYWLNKTR